MRLPLIAAFAAVLSLAAPVAAQDLFKPLQDLVEGLTSPPPKAVPRKPVAVEAPESVPPVPRPRPEEEAEPVAVEAAEGDVPPLPQPRPGEHDAPVVEESVAPVEVPEAKPAEDVVADRVYQTACPAVLLGQVEAEANPPLSEDMCGERSPLTVTAVLANGRMVKLSSPVITNCEMASALPAWVSAVDGYATSALDSPLVEVVTGTSYMCRKRNNADEGFTSEHGFANAVDVTGFALEDGRSIGVEGQWMPAAAPEGRLLRFAHDAGCTGFTTVLGPEANAEHHDHLHLDLGCHGKSCTARICE
jgi:hypothetical protein